MASDLKIGTKNHAQEVMVVGPHSRRAAAIGGLCLCAGLARAQPLTELFDSVPALAGSGWVAINRSSPVGSSGWFQGNTTFSAQASSGYLATDYRCVASVGTISNWMLLPTLTLNNGGVLQFWTRTVSPSVYADRLQVRLSTAGPSTNVGAGPLDTGDFAELLLDINPNYITWGDGSYPTQWMQVSVTLAGLPGPTQGRLALRYFVEHGGENGSRSDYIGIDSVTYTTGPVPQGRCCILATGACLVTSSLTCTGQGGVYAGDSTVCSGFTCPQPPTGACCTAQGTCQILTAAACSYAGGVYRGNSAPCTAGDCPQSFTYTGDPIEVHDGFGIDGCGPVASASVTVAQNFRIASVGAAFGITHFWQGDLRISLTKVGGPTVTLVDRPGYPQMPYGFSGNDYGVPLASPAGYFRAASGGTLYDIPAVSAPGLSQPTGTWLAEGSLAQFIGLDSQGTWQLDVADCAGGDTGVIYKFDLALGVGCFANCDGSSVNPVLNANDFQCFLNQYAGGDPRANCDQSSTPPLLNANDFQCFLNYYAAGCS